MIIVAVTIGGVISAICIGVVIYITVKAVKNKGLVKRNDLDEEDHDRLNQLIGQKRDEFNAS